jgi:exopolysaccharide biosynthesis polyprenyl glycosylphosphotransferase
MDSSRPIADKLIPGTAVESERLGAKLNSNGREWIALVAALILSDALAVGAAFRAAFWLRFESGLEFFEAQALASVVYYQRLVLVLTPLWILIFLVNGLYKRDYLLGGTQEYARVFRSTTIGLLIIMAADFLRPEFIIARGWVLLAWFLTFFFVALGRFIIRRVIYAFRRKGLFLSRTLIIGANSEACALAEQLRSWTTSGLEVVGFISDDHPVGLHLQKDLNVVGGIENLDQLVKEQGIKELIIAGGALPQETELAVFRKFGMSDDVSLRLSLGLYEIIATGLSVREFAYVPLVEVNKVRLTGANQVLKTILDYVFTLPLLVLLTPLLLLISILVKIDSPGPILHRRRVMGLNGRQFDAYKFRTMHVNGDEILDRSPELKAELAANHKLKDDPRVTRLGHFLRRFSLDELPQFLNVIKRDMSVVGPRMISPVEMEQYAKWGINLLTVRPGITGLWQVSGRSDVDYQERVRLDMQYVRNWTIWLDLQLILRTIPAVLNAKGAY